MTQSVLEAIGRPISRCYVCRPGEVGYGYQHRVVSYKGIPLCRMAWWYSMEIGAGVDGSMLADDSISCVPAGDERASGEYTVVINEK